MKENETKVLKSDMKGTPMFAVFEFNEEGEKNFKPVLRMGIRKAKLILKHLEELKTYVEKTK